MTKTMTRLKVASVFHDRYDNLRIGWCIALMVVVISIIATSGTIIGRQIGFAAGVGVCHIKSKQMNRPTKLVQYNYFSWECMTPNPSQPGQWIPVNKLVGVK